MNTTKRASRNFGPKVELHSEECLISGRDPLEVESPDLIVRCMVKKQRFEIRKSTTKGRLVLCNRRTVRYSDWVDAGRPRNLEEFEAWELKNKHEGDD